MILIFIFVIVGVIPIGVGVVGVAWFLDKCWPSIKLAREQRKARSAYLRALSPDNRKAFLARERRHYEFLRLGPYEPWKTPNEWDDVIADRTSGNLITEGVWFTSTGQLPSTSR